MAGGMFLESFWKSLLISLDSIIKRTKDLAQADINDNKLESQFSIDTIRQQLNDEIYQNKNAIERYKKKLEEMEN